MPKKKPMVSASANMYGDAYAAAVGGKAATKSVTGDVGKKVVDKSKVAKGMFKHPKRAAAIGLGLGVATSVAMNRRGKGVSPGNQSNARY